MPSDIPAVKAKIVEERAVVAATVALIDFPAEKALVDAAQVQLDAAQDAFAKKTRRWAVLNEKRDRLAELDAQISLFTP